MGSHIDLIYLKFEVHQDGTKTMLKTVDRTFLTVKNHVHFYYKHVRTKLVIVQTCHNMFGLPNVISSTAKRCIMSECMQQ